MKLQEAIAQQICNQEDIAWDNSTPQSRRMYLRQAGEIVETIKHFISHNLGPNSTTDILRSIEEDHMP